MSDEQQDQQDQRDADQQDQQQDTHESDDLGDKGKAALKAERDARKVAEKARTELEKRIADFEKQQRDAEEAKQKEAGEWETVATEKDAELTKLKAAIAERDLKDRKAAIAKAHELPEDLIDRLQGETDEELETDAKALAKLMAARETPDNDAGQRTPPGSKKRDRKQFADPARWGLR